MKRITAIVTAASASGALAVAAVSTGMLPAAASTASSARPAARIVSHTAAHPVKRQIARKANAKPTAARPVQILSQYGNGQYVSVVHCQSGQTPPPLHLRQPGVPLHLAGQQPSTAVTHSLGQYKPVYRCTLVIKKKPVMPGKGGGIKPCEHVKPGTHGKCNVTVNTGFGGAAGSVKGHRPRH